MSAAQPDLILGGVPRADLLPQEVRNQQRGKALVRKLIVGLVILAVLVAGGIGFATVRSMTAGVLLTAERARTDALLAEQLTYAEARSVNNAITLAVTAREVGMATEIDWEAYLAEIDATIPAGISLTSIRVDSISPAEALVVPEAPLQGESVATISIEATSQSVPEVETWLDQMETLTGFAGIAPPVQIDGNEQAGFVVTIQVQVNKDAFLNRFAEETEGDE
jgi:Tfp pilus assembly protein PilN